MGGILFQDIIAKISSAYQRRNATVGVTNNDEVTKFQSGRYISSSEGIWRILSFPIHERHPPVIHLNVHLEGGQRMYFIPVNVMERLENPK